MAYQRSYMGSTTSGQSATVVMSTPPAVGNLIITGTLSISGTAHACSDNATGGSNSYSQNVFVANTSIAAATHHAYVARTNAGGLTVTGNISVGASSSGFTVFASEFNGNISSGNFVAGQSGTKTQTSSTAMMATGAVTNSVGDSVYISCWGSNASATPTVTAATNYTRIQQQTNGAGVTGGFAYQAVLTSASRTFGGQISSGTYQACVGAVYNQSVNPTRTVPSNAALLQVVTRSVAANAALLQQLPRSVPMNTALLRPTVRDVPQSAGLLRKTTRAVGEQAALIWRPVRSLAAYAMLQIGATQVARSLAANAALKKLTTRAVPAYSALRKLTTRAVGQSAALLWRPTRSVAQSVVLRKLLTRAVSASASLKRLTVRTIGASVALKKYTTRTVGSNAALKRILTRAVPAQAALRRLTTRSLTASAVLLKRIARSVGASAALLRPVMRNVPLFAYLMKAIAISLPSWAALKNVVQVEIRMWAYLKPTIGQVEVAVGVGEAERLRAQKILFVSRTSAGGVTAESGTSRAARILTGIGRLTGRIRP